MDGKICIAPVAKSPESGKNAMAAERKLKVSFYEVTAVQGGIRRNSVFNFIGPRDQLIISFWRALRELQGRYDPSEYEKRWYEPFPTREMEVLTQRIGALKQG